MKLADIRTAVETLLGMPVSIESVSWCLRMGSRKDLSNCERVARGVYRLRPQTWFYIESWAWVNARLDFAP